MGTYYFEMDPVAGGAGESTLSPLYADLVTAIQDAFPDLTDTALLARLIKEAYLMFLYPADVLGKGSHTWSFLSPSTTLSTIEEYSTGTVDVTDGDATVELSGGTWPSWAESATIAITDDDGDEHEFTVEERTDNDTIELAEEWDGDTDTGLSYTIHYHPADYDLPASFGGLIGEQIVLESTDEYYPPMKVISPEQIQRFRLGYSTASTPRYAAIQPKAFVSATGSRWELLIFPEPDDDYTARYRYNVNPDAVASGQYPIGGAQHALTIRAACRARAEMKMGGGVRGHYFAEFADCLKASIQQDEGFKAKNLGYNKDDSDAEYGYDRLADGVLYNGSDVSV